MARMVRKPLTPLAKKSNPFLMMPIPSASITRIRGELDNAIAGFRLFDPDPKVRLAAVRELDSEPDPAMAPLLAKALSSETDPKVKDLLALIAAQADVKSTDAAVRLAAVKMLGNSSTSNIKNLLASMVDPANEPDSKVRLAAFESLRAVEKRIAWGDALSRIFTGLSLGSILARRIGLGDHLWRHGGDQHGSRRIVDGRCLRNFCDSGRLPQIFSVAGRLVCGRGDSLLPSLQPHSLASFLNVL